MCRSNTAPGWFSNCHDAGQSWSPYSWILWLMAQQLTQHCYRHRNGWRNTATAVGHSFQVCTCGWEQIILLDGWRTTILGNRQGFTWTTASHSLCFNWLSNQSIKAQWGGKIYNSQSISTLVFIEVDTSREIPVEDQIQPLGHSEEKMKWWKHPT